MTQRDIAKDKILLQVSSNPGEIIAIGVHWIAQYEDMKVKYSCAALDHVLTLHKLERLQARISDLEAQLASKDPMTLANLPAHDRALKKILGEIGS